MAESSSYSHLVNSPGYGHIIDVHSHVLLPRWIEALRKATGQGRDQIKIAGAAVPEWSLEKHLDMMDQHGIASCILSWPGAVAFLKGQEARDLARALNEDLAEIIAKHPTRFGAFAILPLDDLEATHEAMAYALDVLKLDGVSTGTNIGGVYLGDPVYDAWFAEMNRRKTTIFIHPSVPGNNAQLKLDFNAAIIEFMFDTTRMVTNMVLTGAKKRFSDINMLSTHGGGTIPYLASRISILEPEFGAGPGRPVLSSEEVMEGLSSFYYDLTASTAPASLDSIRHLVPASRLMLGFDYPMMPSGTIHPALNRFQSNSSITAEDRAAMISGTALKLFPALAKRRG